MSRRTQFLGSVLKQGNSFIFTDTDVLWLRDPFPRSNNRSIAIFDEWYARRNVSSGIKEQDVLRQIRKEGMFRTLGFSVRYWDTDYFSGFCNNSRDVRAVITVHANCYRTIAAKVADLTKVLHDWKRFIRSPSSSSSSSTKGTAAFRWSAHVACRHSWDSWH
ncbi:uncharacterized protein At1g28695-like [Eucalyptus grandis]|uniref:uncharacterized protein At1g28695-like n=1 Tax=Eucalyptus grandis TaxID=71139 RepID=UPI00192EE0D2|nr:uncharacterized protein At1g28695-like [Eucalyptus grandis]